MVFMKTVSRLTGIAALVLGGQACSPYRTLSVEILQPAEVYLEPNHRLALLDRNFITPSQTGSLLETCGGISRRDLFVEFVHGMNQVLGETHFFDTLLPLGMETETRWEDDRWPGPIEPDSVRELGTECKADYLAVVEMQFYKPGRHDFADQWGIRLYETASGRPVDSVLLASTHAWNMQDEEDLKTDLLGAAWDKGAELARRIVPYWEKTVRRVYCSGKTLRLGDAFYQENRLAEAEQVWQGARQLAPKIALRAMINLAWLAENAGEFQRASGLLEEAGKFAADQHMEGEEVSYLRQYMDMIDLRISKANILDRQLPLGEEDAEP